MSLTFGLTSKNRPTAVYMNHTFNQYSKNNKNHTHWRCTEYSRSKCRAKLVTFENQMLEKSTPLHTHTAANLKIGQKYIKGAHDQQTCSRTLLSAQLKAMEKDDDQQNRYNASSPQANSEDMDVTSDEEFWHRWNTRSNENNEKSQFIQRFRNDSVDKPNPCTSNSINFDTKPVVSKTVLRTMSRKLRKNQKINIKDIPKREIKWINY